MVYLPYLVPRAELVPAQAGPLHKPYFLFAGRLEKLKGLHTLIPVFQRYDRAELWIAGAGTEEKRLRQLAAGGDNIRFLGRVDTSHLAALYRDAVAVIVPSLCYEVFSLVPIEAMQQGTPVIVRNLGAMPEVVQESGAGLVYNTEEELVQGMDRLLGDRVWRNELGERGHRTYLREWTPERHLERYLGLVEQLGQGAILTPALRSSIDAGAARARSDGREQG
jgi:glycosyltransferase involved in cell wall biosynthesis